MIFHLVRMVLAWLFIVFFFFNTLFCQDKINCTNDLAIVRLYLNKPKKIHLEKGFANADNEKDKILFQNELIRHTKNRLNYTMNVISNFRKYYPNPENIRFIPDSLWSDFKAGNIRNYFINDGGSLDDKVINPVKLNYFVIARGEFDEDFYAIDQNDGTPLSPFPGKLKHTLITKLGSVFSDAMKTSVERYCQQIRKYCDEN